MVPARLFQFLQAARTHHRNRSANCATTGKLCEISTYVSPNCACKLRSSSSICAPRNIKAEIGYRRPPALAVAPARAQCQFAAAGAGKFVWKRRMWRARVHGCQDFCHQTLPAAGLVAADEFPVVTTIGHPHPRIERRNGSWKIICI